MWCSCRSHVMWIRKTPFASIADSIQKQTVLKSCRPSVHKGWAPTLRFNAFVTLLSFHTNRINMFHAIKNESVRKEEERKKLKVWFESLEISHELTPSSFFLLLHSWVEQIRCEPSQMHFIGRNTGCDDCVALLCALTTHNGEINSQGNILSLC